MTPEQIKKIIQEKVSNVWEVAHTTSGHRYLHVSSGKYQDSVTTKLGILAKPHLLPWAVRVGVEFLLEGDRLERIKNPNWKDELIQGAQMAHLGLRDSAGLTGTKTHSFAERYINEWLEFGKKPEDIMSLIDINKDDPRAIAGARSFELAFSKNKIIPLASEIIVGHPDYSCGALDLLVLWGEKEELCLLDIKTSNSVDKNFRYQLVAYKKFFEFMCPELKIKKVKILHLSKDMAKCEIYNVKSLPQAWKTFKNICQIYDDIMSKKEKVVKDIKRIVI
jgi:hypothetical protein